MSNQQKDIGWVIIVGAVSHKAINRIPGIKLAEFGQSHDSRDTVKTGSFKQA